MSELHQKAESFVLCALADDTCGDQEQNNDVGLFLLSLILGHKKRQRSAASMEEVGAKTRLVVASSERVCQEIKP